MAENNTNEKERQAQSGDMPQWLETEVQKPTIVKTRVEIEVKFLLPREKIDGLLSQSDVKKSTIHQYYVPFEVVQQECAKIPIQIQDTITLPEGAETYDEWRVRSRDEKCVLTGKKKSKQAAVRQEFEIDIAPELFLNILKGSGDGCYCVEKTRYSKSVHLAGDTAQIDLDDYHRVGTSTQRSQDNLDFITCEVEVANVNLANTLIKGYLFISELQFLKGAIDVTGVSAFSNKNLARHGFPAADYQALKVWLRKEHLEELNRLLLPTDLEQAAIVERVNNLTDRILKLNDVSKQNRPPEQVLNIHAAQDILSDVAFTKEDSMGRKDNSNPELQSLDSMSKGWLRDFHTIVSSDPYLRLSRKPQVFRASASNINVTTRGAHTQDVIACSMQLARQLGLNVELCAAIAALHDIGHPAGGHVGEEVLRKLSGRAFKHHVFSLSLADIFSLNLLKEVQVGAFYHKTGGGKLRIPDRRPQEFGVVMIADKICYTAWDLFDAMDNDYIKESDVSRRCFDVLGNEPLDWIQAFIKTVVLESAQMHSIQFTEESGEIFELYKQAKTLILENVHTQIRWDSLKADISTCYEAIKKGFPDLDPVPIVAYMTDDEVDRVARMMERRPKSKVPDLAEYKREGLNFCDIIEKFQSGTLPPGSIYYVAQSKEFRDR